MDYFADVQRGIDFIEDHLAEPLDLQAVSAIAGFSHFHFQRLFKAITGETLKTYVRSRRLAGAMELLATTDLRVLDVATASGFESQESFARAFKRTFGLTPTAYRDIGAQNLFPHKLRIDASYLSNLDAICGEPEIREMEPMTVVGLRTRFVGPTTQKNSVAGDLPALWDAFVEVMGGIEELQSSPLFGVIDPVAGDEEYLDYWAAGRIRATEAQLARTVDRGFEVTQVPGGRYAVFEHRGPHQLLDRTVDYVYGAWLMAPDRTHAQGPDLEIYDERWLGDDDASIMSYAVPIG